MIKVQMVDIDKPKSDTPVFRHCRRLIKQGIDPEEVLEVYGPSIANPENNILYLRMKVGIGAKLTVDKDTTKFARYTTPSDTVKNHQLDDAD